MKKFLKVFAPIALGLGMLALACSSNNKGNPAAPSSPLPPTNTPCVDSQGHTCTPTVTATPTNTFTPTPTITPGPLNVTAPTTLTTGGYAFTTVDIGQALYINGAVTIDAGTYFNLPAGATIIGDGGDTRREQVREQAPILAVGAMAGPGELPGPDRMPDRRMTLPPGPL